MKLINRSTQSPLARQACDIALAAHAERCGLSCPASRPPVHPPAA
ncbi:DUF4060 family protein [Escherichia coli]|nr:DUF4060 family protein [Escherichia coli]